MATNKSEILFEEYLTNKGLERDQDFFYEPDLKKTKKPDYLVKDEGDLLFEVKEFSRENKHDKRFLSSKGVVRMDTYSQIRTKIGKARTKFKEFKNDFPCILVLYKGNSITVSLDVQIVAAAMFGDISMRFYPDGSSSPWLFDRNGELSPTKNKTLSGISIVDEVFPEKDAAMKEFWQVTRPKLKNETMEEISEMFTAWSATHGFDLRNRIIRLITIVNPFASKKISQDFFRGSLDEIYTIDQSGSFGRLR